MNKKVIVLGGLVLALTSCGIEESTLDKISNAANQVKGLKENVKNASSIVSSAKEMQENIKRLKETIPISKDAMKQWMPEALEDLKRSKFSIGKHMGIANVASIDLEFKSTDAESGKFLRLKVVDCAGEAAAIMAMQLMITNVDIDSEDEQGYERTEVFDNQKILVKHKTSEYGLRTNFNYQINDRLLVEAKGTNMGADELWFLVKVLNIQDLLN